jgi:hypothetical protein
LQPSAFNIAPPPVLQWQPVRIANFIAIAGRAYPVNTTSSAITTTLPLNPNPGDQVTFTDYAGTFATNNLTINPNGNKVEGSTLNQVVSVNRGSVNLVYIDSTQGWVTYSNVATDIVIPETVSIDFILVAGGGGGGGYNGGGGGGAGGLLYETGLSLSSGVSYSITIGSSGSGGTGSAYATDGTNSTISGTGITTKTAFKGGAGGSGNQGSNTNGNGGSGTYGSGGGVGRDVTTAVAGAGTSGQGFAGGAANPSLGSGGSGGGGAGGAGNASSGTENAIAPAGDGGVGSSTYSSLLTIVSAGVDVGGTRYIAGGGGGAGYQTTRNPAGGYGGGGQGSMRELGATGATAGATNTGSGGGGGGNTAPFKTVGQNGGSGICIIKAPRSAVSTTGIPDTYTSGGFTYYKFTGNGSITF